MQPQQPFDRKNLVLEHLGLAKSLAISLSRKLSLRPDLYDEVTALANAGLAEAASRYDPSKGTAFSTFAYYRIRGAVYDGLRAMGILGKRQRSRAKLEQRTDEMLEQAANTPVMGSPAGPSLESTIQEIAANVADAVTVQMVWLDVETLAEPAERAADALASAELNEVSGMVREAMEHLDQAERQIIELAYFKDLSLKEAGDQMGLSRSWACRLHRRAIKKLRTVLPDIA